MGGVCQAHPLDLPMRMQNTNKEIGLGVIKSYPPVEDYDLVKLRQYF